MQVKPVVPHSKGGYMNLDNADSLLAGVSGVVYSTADLTAYVGPLTTLLDTFGDTWNTATAGGGSPNGLNEILGTGGFWWYKKEKVKRLPLTSKVDGDIITHNLNNINVFILTREPSVWSAIPQAANTFKLIGPPTETYTGDVLIFNI